MSETLEQLRGALLLIAGAAGVIGSELYAELRRRYPRERCATWPRWAAALLWEPRTAAWAAPALGALVGVLASTGAAVIAAAAAGEPLSGAIDSGLALAINALAGAWASQQQHHARTRPAAPPTLVEPPREAL